MVTNVLLDMLPIFCVARKEELYFGNQALFEPLESHCVHISWASLGKDAPQSLVNIQLAGTRLYRSPKSVVDRANTSDLCWTEN